VEHRPGRRGPCLCGRRDSVDGFSDDFRAVQSSFAGGRRDAFLSKLDATGSSLVYSTYLGGSDDDFSEGLAVDGAGNAYVSGWTRSGDPYNLSCSATDLARRRRRCLCDEDGRDRAAYVTGFGWKALGVFKNQGDCVSFVVTKGKNPPSAP